MNDLEYARWRRRSRLKLVIDEDHTAEADPLVQAATRLANMERQTSMQLNDPEYPPPTDGDGNPWPTGPEGLPIPQPG